MPAAYRAGFVGGSTSGTSNRTVVVTPVANDLVVVFCMVAANSNTTPTCSDGNTGGTYTRIAALSATIATISYVLSVFVRDALIPNTTSTTITVATGSNTSGAVHAFAVSGMTKLGAAAVRSSGSQSNAAAATPAPALSQSCLTNNPTFGCVGNGANPATMTAPTSWTEVASPLMDTGFASDAVGLESVYRNSGFTGTTVMGQRLIDRVQLLHP